VVDSITLEVPRLRKPYEEPPQSLGKVWGVRVLPS
jgi:hypothetical protein